LTQVQKLGTFPLLWEEGQLTLLLRGWMKNYSTGSASYLHFGWLGLASWGQPVLLTGFLLMWLASQLASLLVSMVLPLGLASLATCQLTVFVG
jgi:hypothetical protein